MVRRSGSQSLLRKPLVQLFKLVGVDHIDTRLEQRFPSELIVWNRPQAKPLSFREKKMLERARYLLVSELAMARNCEEAKVEELLTTALAKCKLRFPEASEFQA